MTRKKVAASCSLEVWERAARLVLEGGGGHSTQWSAIDSVSAKIGCTVETPRKRVRQAGRDGGQRPGPTSANRERVKALERETWELRQANEIFSKQVLQACVVEHGLGQLQAAVFCFPGVKGRTRYPVPAAQVRHHHARVGLLPAMLRIAGGMPMICSSVNRSCFIPSAPRPLEEAVCRRAKGDLLIGPVNSSPMSGSVDGQPEVASLSIQLSRFTRFPPR